MKTLGVVCAREGSKGVVGKNKRQFADTTLADIALDQLVGYDFTDVTVSTDDRLVTSKAYKRGMIYLINRPEYLCGDSISKMSVFRDALVNMEEQTGTTYDMVVDLSCTTPFRSIGDISDTIGKMKGQVDIATTATTSARSPYFNIVEIDRHGYVSLCKPYATDGRQGAPETFDLVASVFCVTREFLMSGRSYWNSTIALNEIPEERSMEIDTEFEFSTAELLYKNMKE